jgi:hypothetical protein
LHLSDWPSLFPYHHPSDHSTPGPAKYQAGKGQRETFTAGRKMNTAYLERKRCLVSFLPSFLPSHHNRRDTEEEEETANTDLSSRMQAVADIGIIKVGTERAIRRERERERERERDISCIACRQHRRFVTRLLCIAACLLVCTTVILFRVAKLQKINIINRLCFLIIFDESLDNVCWCAHLATLIVWWSQATLDSLFLSLSLSLSVSLYLSLSLSLSVSLYLSLSLSL